MFNQISFLTLLWILLHSGQCFRYERNIERKLCRTQCKALCIDNKEACASFCIPQNLYRFWIANCDEPFVNCIGTCQILAPRNRIVNIYSSKITDFPDDSSLYPHIPTLHLSSIQGDTIMLTWDLPNDVHKVCHVIQIKSENTEWQILVSELDSNHYNATVPDICLYQFRIMAINQFGSNGYSSSVSVKDIPLEPIHNITFVGNYGLYYHEATGEFMGVIEWDDISGLDEKIVDQYNWNDMSYVQCPRVSQNMQPYFSKFSAKHGRKYIIMRVSRDAYGCVFTTQVKAKSVCNDTGGWTNFTIDLSDCNNIFNFPCSTTDPNFSPPGNVRDVKIKVDRGQDPPLIRLLWLPPRDLGTAGKLDHYDIRWGRITHKNKSSEPDFFLQQPDFDSVPNITRLSATSKEFTVAVTYADLISTRYEYGFQIIPVAPNQMLKESEYGIFEIYRIQSSRNGHTIHGTILMDGDGVQVVQVNNSLDVELAWHLHRQVRSDQNLEDIFNEKYAIKLMEWKDEGHVIRNEKFILTDAANAYTRIHMRNSGDYCVQIMGLQNETSPVNDKWKEIKFYCFSVKELEFFEDEDEFSTALQIILPVLITITIPTALITFRWINSVHKLRKKLKMESRLGDLTMDFHNDYANMDTHPLTSHYYNRESRSLNLQPTVVPDKWELPVKCLMVGRLLGSGAFGQVLKGRVSKSMILHRNLPIPRGSDISKTFISVAVKMLKDNADVLLKQDFLKEIALMKTIGKHANIVGMLGCCTLQDPVCLVVEHLPHGDLKTYLSKMRKTVEMKEEEVYYINRNVDLPNPADLLSFGRQIAVGMEFLSSKGFVHRDLAARNVLVGNDKIIKIGDFGLTRFVFNDQVYINRNGGKFPLKWMAIESIEFLRFSAQSDVWSFGIVLFEIVTLGGTPYPNIDPIDLLEFLKNGRRIERPENCSEELYQIMMLCWEQFPSCRPTFSALKEMLESMMLDSCGVEYFHFGINESKYYQNIVENDEILVENNVIESKSSGPLNDKSERQQTVSTDDITDYGERSKDNTEVLEYTANNFSCFSAGNENDVTVNSFKEGRGIISEQKMCLQSIDKNPIENQLKSLNSEVGTDQRDNIKAAYESEPGSTMETNTKSTWFGLEVITSLESDDYDYEADDSSLSETSPSTGCKHVFLSSSNEEDKIFNFPEHFSAKRNLQEKRPRFKNRLTQKSIHQRTRRQLSNVTDSGISTSSYSESL
ncbi:uncharacterized protein LOC127698929 [Mytilus californianus]|uniref:uncharacterized protein LOC127698929 n=1 Tax=Mytilus californianus TaxID=6549 RepID=UPI002247C313|nr:uncharacterized protein LOC127698929 [Mytilus californianus]